ADVVADQVLVIGKAEPEGARDRPDVEEEEECEQGREERVTGDLPAAKAEAARQPPGLHLGDGAYGHRTTPLPWPSHVGESSATAHFFCLAISSSVCFLTVAITSCGVATLPAT